MAETTNPAQQQDNPILTTKIQEPAGVLQKYAKPVMYLGVALLVIIAAALSARSTTGGAKAATTGQAPQPSVQDNTDNNIQDLRNQLAAKRDHEREEAAQQQSTNDAALAPGTPAQRATAQGYSPTGQTISCLPGQPCPSNQPYGYSQQGGGQQSAEQQMAEQLAARDKQKSYEARFSSNLAYTRPAEIAQGSVGPANARDSEMAPASTSYGQAGTGSTSLVNSRAPGEPAVGQASIKRGPEVNIDSAAGQPYVLFEGTTLDTVLMNRLDGDAVGPVKVLVSNPVYSHDRQHVLVPEGTIVLGEARKIGQTGFGQQRRIAVSFHRLIMPDGYSVDLDQFHGLDQIGEEGLKDKVNNHYLQIFGASIALGVIAGAAQATQGGGIYTSSGPQIYVNGASASVSQSATTILDRFMQVPPTITIREGHRVKVYFTQDLLLPAYENHTIP